MPMQTVDAVIDSARWGLYGKHVRLVESPGRSGHMADNNGALIFGQVNHGAAASRAGATIMP